MALYAKFADIYHRGPYPGFSRTAASLLPVVLERFGSQPQSLLDVACGEGTFAIEMASRQSLAVTGVDLSAHMLEIARQQAAQAGVSAAWVQQDMRQLDFTAQFDLVTCWFDSLNYLLEDGDLLATFKGMQRALKRQGLLVFDMNTIYGLTVEWQRENPFIQQDTEDLFEVHQNTFDYERMIATVKISVFLRQDEAWTRFDEEHQERAYPVEQIQAILRKAGLEPLACFGSLRELTEPKPTSGRVWFVARNP